MSKGPGQSPAMSTAPYSQQPQTVTASVTKKKTKLYRIRIKKKRLLVVTEPKAEIVVKIFPKNGTVKQAKRKNRFFVYYGKADKTGRYVLKTDRIKKKYKIQIRVCKKGKAAVIQKWRLSC